MGRHGAGWAIDALEAVYEPAPTLTAWVDTVSAALEPDLGRGHGVAAQLFRWRDGQLELFSQRSVGLSVREKAALETGVAAHEGGQVRALFGPSCRPLETYRTVLTREAPAPRFSMPRLLVEAGIRDFIGAVGLDATGVGYVFSSPRPEVVASLPEAESRRWARLRAHLLAGLRLHVSEAAEPEAVLAPDGELRHAEGGARTATARARLRAAARTVDRARSRAGRADPDAALEAWEALVSGRWTLVDRFDSDGRRFLVARRNDPSLVAPRPLGPRQRQVLTYAALGRSNKEIAYELGLAPSTVSSCLRRGMRRLGVVNRAALADLFMPPARAEAAT